MISKYSAITVLVLILSIALFAQNSGKKEWNEESWGLGLAMRVGTIPFSTDEKSVSTVVPMIFYENSFVYLNGLESGLKFYTTDKWRFSALTRRHFFDAPKEVQNVIQGDNIDVGLQARYALPYSMFVEGEMMTDVVVNDDYWRGNPSGNLRLVHKLSREELKLDSFFELKLKSKRYNSWYFGLDEVDVNTGIDMSLGFILRYHLISNLYLFGAGELTLLDKNARAVQIASDNINVSVNSDMHAQVFFGFGFSNDVTKPRKEKLRNAGYWRLGMGFATPSTLGEIFRFESIPDTNSNKLTSIFYGHPLTDEFFGLPLEIYLTPGFAWHWQSDVQPNSFEVNLAVKFYYTIKWPIRWRLGAAEGVSYVNKVPYMEEYSLADKEYKPSNLMNYLDFSIDFNVGDIFGSKPMKQWWIGYYIHHRSSIFESAQQFGRISGGSNYHTIYLLWNY